MRIPSETVVPCVPDGAPFSTEQRAWLNGLFAGLYSTTTVDPALLSGDPAGSSSAAAPVTILYGTQTGTAEQLAKHTARALEEAGLRPTVYDMLDYEPEALSDERHVLILSSTHGEGDMPDNAALFWEALQSDSAPRLEEARFSVLGLGDTSYPDFCAAGKNFDRRLATLGARRITPRVDCDVDYDEAFQGWLEEVIAALSDRAKDEGERSASDEEGPASASDGSASDRVPAFSSVSVPSSTAAAHAYFSESSFPAPLLVNRRLTAAGSNKDTRHVEVSIEGANFSYEVGDALGVRPANSPELVDEVLGLLECTGKESVPGLGGMGAGMPLREALTHHYEIRIPSRTFLKRLARTSGHETLEQLLEPAARTELQDYLEGREVTDVLRDFPLAHKDPRAFVGLLGRLQPRLYSISSSPTVHVNEVHLTVAPVRYAARGQHREGVCSTFLSDRMYPGTRVPVYVQENKHFSLPVDGRVPLIMVGPGTGIAPFRAFLHERRATKARGRNWLFFGDRHAATDFLYKDELHALREEGVLTRLNTAFSRDQEEKVYVQHRMMQHATDLFSWLEDGAHFYVCGDAGCMARDVDETLHRVIEEAGGFTGEQASAYVRQMRKERRYQRDVY